MNAPIIIIGAGLAGWAVAREVRKLSPNQAITIISSDTGDFYAKPALSNALVQGKTPAQLVTTPRDVIAAHLGVTVFPHTEVKTIDAQRQVLQTSQGEFTYSKLVLATGASPIVLPIEGDAANDIFRVNNLTDYAKFRAALKPNAKVLILGAGLIGSEFANDLALSGYKVSLADPNSRPLAALLPSEISEKLQTALSEQGVAFYFNNALQALNKKSNGLSAQLKNGENLTVDAVLSAVGLRPNTQLAKSADVAVERGILVDETLQTSIAKVYALGDCAQYRFGNFDALLPYVQPISFAAKVLAQNLLNTEQQTLKFPPMPVMIKTPSLPIAVLAPKAIGGVWEIKSSNEGDIGRYIANEKLSGFVLTGKQTSKRVAMLGQLTI